MQNIVDHLVSIWGSQAKVAAVAGVKQSSVAEWKARGVVPVRPARKLLGAAREGNLPLNADHFFSMPEGNGHDPSKTPLATPTAGPDGTG